MEVLPRGLNRLMPHQGCNLVDVQCHLVDQQERKAVTQRMSMEARLSQLVAPVACSVADDAGAACDERSFLTQAHDAQQYRHKLRVHHHRSMTALAVYLDDLASDVHVRDLQACQLAASEPCPEQDEHKVRIAPGVLVGRPEYPVDQGADLLGREPVAGLGLDSRPVDLLQGVDAPISALLGVVEHKAQGSDVMRDGRRRRCNRATVDEGLHLLTIDAVNHRVLRPSLEQPLAVAAEPALRATATVLVEACLDFVDDEAQGRGSCLPPIVPTKRRSQAFHSDLGLPRVRVDLCCHLLAVQVDPASESGPKAADKTRQLGFAHGADSTQTVHNGARARFWFVVSWCERRDSNPYLRDGERILRALPCAICHLLARITHALESLLSRPERAGYVLRVKLRLCVWLIPGRPDTGPNSTQNSTQMRGDYMPDSAPESAPASGGFRGRYVQRTPSSFLKRRVLKNHFFSSSTVLVPGLNGEPEGSLQEGSAGVACLRSIGFGSIGQEMGLVRAMSGGDAPSDAELVRLVGDILKRRDSKKRNDAGLLVHWLKTGLWRRVIEDLDLELRAVKARGRDGSLASAGDVAAELLRGLRS